MFAESVLFSGLGSVFPGPQSVPGRTSHPDSKKQNPHLWRTHCVDQASLELPQPPELGVW